MQDVLALKICELGGESLPILPAHMFKGEGGEDTVVGKPDLGRTLPRLLFALTAA